MSLLLCVLNGCATEVWAQQRTGRIAHVVDGDTLEVLLGQRRVRVTLAGVEAPRRRIADRLRARQSLIAICGGEVARLDAYHAHSRGEARARVMCNGIDAGAEQVRLGMASVSSRETENPGLLLALQHEAMTARRGLWARNH